jgi:hypothetical protein
MRPPRERADDLANVLAPVRLEEEELRHGIEIALRRVEQDRAQPLSERGSARLTRPADGEPATGEALGEPGQLGRLPRALDALRT